MRSLHTFGGKCGAEAHGARPERAFTLTLFVEDDSPDAGRGRGHAGLLVVRQERGEERLVGVWRGLGRLRLAGRGKLDRRRIALEFLYAGLLREKLSCRH